MGFRRVWGLAVCHHRAKCSTPCCRARSFGSSPCRTSCRHRATRRRAWCRGRRAGSPRTCTAARRRARCIVPTRPAHTPAISHRAVYERRQRNMHHRGEFPSAFLCGWGLTYECEVSSPSIGRISAMCRWWCGVPTEPCPPGAFPPYPFTRGARITTVALQRRIVSPWRPGSTHSVTSLGTMGCGGPRCIQNATRAISNGAAMQTPPGGSRAEGEPGTWPCVPRKNYLCILEHRSRAFVHGGG